MLGRLVASVPAPSSLMRTPTFISGRGWSKYARPIRVYEKLATGTTGFSLLRDRICRRTVSEMAAVQTRELVDLR
jgi:hypothetical protein